MSSSKQRWFPDSLVMIFIMILVAQLVSYALPAGEFDTVTMGGQEQVVPGTYHATDVPPLPAWAFLTAVPRGMVAAGEIILFVFLVGGAVGVVRATGAIDALIGAAIRRFSSNRVLLVTGMMTLFALGSSTIGMGEEYIPFVPVLVAMCVALGMDAIVALAMVEIGLGVGHGCAATNPFTVVLAQRIAGLDLYSGQIIRWTLLVLCLGISVHHVMGYVRRITDDPSRSLVADLNSAAALPTVENVPFTPRRVAVILSFVGTVGFFVFGVARWGWFLNELGASFLGLALLASLVGGLGPNQAARQFGKGAAELTMAALLIGFARSIQVVLDDAGVKDTIIHGIGGAIDGLPDAGAAVGMLGVQSFFNLLIPSGSGQAFVTMPIMAPLADITGAGREVAVLAYQFGDGFMNMIVPTSPVLMGFLGMAKVPFVRWAGFITPLLVKIYAVAVVALVATVLLGG